MENITDSFVTKCIEAFIMGLEIYNKSTVFERINILADRKKLSLNEVEKRIGLAKYYLYSLKRRKPTADKLQAIADYFNVPTDYLLGRIELDEREMMDRLYNE